MPFPTLITRREFLLSACLEAAALAFVPLRSTYPSWEPDPTEAQMLGRITRQGVVVHTSPDQASPRVDKLDRDALVPLLESVTSPYEPTYNPRWYRIDCGYIHSAYVQRVETAHLNTPLEAIPAKGRLGEVTMPYIQTLYQNRQGYWVKLYRLYFGSIHWITGLGESPTGEPVYRLTDEWLRVHYWAPAAHLRPVEAAELAPIVPDGPAGQKRLEVSLERQQLTAYEGKEIVRQANVSTGIRYMETPEGEFRVDRKHPSKHMGNGGLTSNLRAYELVGVPWVTFFHEAGIAFHGTYWHDNFGTPMSRGCVNLPTDDALWLFRWTKPEFTFQEEGHPTWKVTGKEGTTVVVKLRS